MKTTFIYKILTVVILIFIPFAFCLHEVGDSDLFWHLKTGEVILNSWQLPKFDIFSYTVLGAPWVNHEWLAEVVFYITWRIGGFMGLSVLSFLVGLGLALSLFKLFKTKIESDAVALLSVLVVFYVGAARLTLLRPEIFAFLFFTILLNLATVRSVKNIFWAVLVVVLWANTHASVILAPLVYFILTLNRTGWQSWTFLFDGVIRSVTSSYTSLKTAPECLTGMSNFANLLCLNRKLFCAWLIVALAPLINPLGIKIYTFPFFHLLQFYQMAVVSDWEAARFLPPVIDLSGWLLMFLLLVFLFVVTKRPQKSVILPSFIVAMLIGLSFFASRFAPFAAVFLIYLLLDLGLFKFDAGFDVTSKKFTILAMVVCGFISFVGAKYGPAIALSVNSSRLNVVLGRNVGVGADEKIFPRQSVNYLKNLKTDIHIFNDMAWGGYLIWAAWPATKVFIDTRTPVYGDTFIKSYSDALFNEAKFNELADKFGLNCVLYDAREISAPDGPLKFMPGKKDWQKVVDTKVEAMWVKR